MSSREEKDLSDRQVGLSERIEHYLRESSWGGKGSRMGCHVEWLSHGLPKNKSTFIRPKSLLCQVDSIPYAFCVYFSFVFFYYLTNPIWSSWLSSIVLSGIMLIIWMYRVKGGVSPRRQCDGAPGPGVRSPQEKDQTQRNGHITW